MKSNTETKQLKHIQNYLHKNNHKKKILHFVNCKKNTNHRLSFYRSGNRSKQYNKMKKVCYRIGVFPSILVLSTK